jgi:hypothetical protein
MSSPGPKISVIAMTLLLTMPLVAQRYQGRDHHVFHPPVQANHQNVPATANATQMRVSTTTSASSARRHDTNLNVPRSNDPLREQAPPSSIDTPRSH